MELEAEGLEVAKASGSVFVVEVACAGHMGLSVGKLDKPLGREVVWTLGHIALLTSSARKACEVARKLRLREPALIVASWDNLFVIALSQISYSLTLFLA